MYDMYRENILDHAQNPRHPGILKDADVDHQELNPLCGDRLRLTLKWDNQGHVEAVAWDGEGCAVSQATASMLGEEIIGKTRDQLKAISRDDVLALIGFPLTMNRMKCALLSLKALSIALYGVDHWHAVEDKEG